MSNDPGKEILEFFLKLIIYAIGGTIGVFVFIEGYSKIDGVKPFLLAIAAFLFLSFYLYPKAESGKKSRQVLFASAIFAVLIIILWYNLYGIFNGLYKNVWAFSWNVILFIIINMILLKFLDNIVKFLVSRVKMK